MKKSIHSLDLTYRGSIKRFSFYTYTQLILHNVNLGGFLKEIKRTAFWFLYAKKDEFVFLNLMPTLLMLRGVVRILESIIFQRGKLMFVNNDLDLFWGAMHVAMESAEPFCVSRWVGGTLTNFKKLWIYFNRFLQYEKWSSLTRPSARLKFSLQGFAYLSSPPSLIFINSLKYSANVANESHAVFIPSVSLVDIDTNSGDTAYMIPSNDDSIVSVDFFNKLFGQIVLINKYRLAKKFLAKKIRRTDSFLNKRAIDFWQRMFFFREKYEQMHTRSYRLCLRNWIALSGFRRTFAGLFVPNFLNKKIDSFVFKNLRTRNYSLLKKLKTVKILRNKAKSLYFKYYKNFFFFRNGFLNTKYNIQLNFVTIQLEWLYEILNKLFRIRKELWVRFCFFKKQKGPLNIILKLKKLNSIVVQQIFYLKKIYKLFLERRFKILQNIIKRKSGFESGVRLLNKVDNTKNILFQRHRNKNLNVITQFDYKNSRRFLQQKGKFDFDQKKEQDTFSWDVLFRRDSKFRHRTTSGEDIMADLRKKYKGMRYWIEVFKARPWLTVRKPLYMLNYPSNFKSVYFDVNLKKKILKKNYIKLLQKRAKRNTKFDSFELFVTYLTDDFTKPSSNLQRKIDNFVSLYKPVDYKSLISSDLYEYYDYIEDKYNTNLWNTWVKQIKNEVGTYETNKKGVFNILFNQAFHLNDKVAALGHRAQVDKKFINKTPLILSQTLSFISCNRFFLKYFVRANAFSFDENKRFFNWEAYRISQSTLMKTVKKFNVSFVKEKLFWFIVKSKYVRNFYKMSINYSLKEMRKRYYGLGYNFSKIGLKRSNNMLNVFENIHFYYNSPLVLNYFFDSKVDKLARLQSNFVVNLKKRTFQRSGKKFQKFSQFMKKKDVINHTNIKSVKRKSVYFKRQKVSHFFGGFHWIQWFGKKIVNLESFIFNKIISKYIFLLKHLKKIQKEPKLHLSYNQMAFLIHRLFIYILLKGIFISSRRNRRLFREIMSEKFFKYSIHQKFFNMRLLFRLFYKLRKKKARWSVFSKAYLNNNAKQFLYTYLLFREEQDPFVKADLIKTNKFFYLSAQKYYKDSVFKNLYNLYGQKWRHGFRWSPRYMGIPARRASFFHMLETSKFSVKRKRRFVLKARKRLFGKTLLEAYLKDFQYGRAKGYRHFFIVREILSRIQQMKKARWGTFMHMLKGNKLVGKPFIKNEIDKFAHPKMFLLRNFGVRKFRNIKRQETQDKVSFIKWYSRQQRKSRSFPGKMNTSYIIRLWTNRSMFFIY